MYKLNAEFRTKQKFLISYSSSYPVLAMRYCRIPDLWGKFMSRSQSFLMVVKGL
jgi:hypothetical protein